MRTLEMTPETEEFEVNNRHFPETQEFYEAKALKLATMSDLQIKSREFLSGKIRHILPLSVLWGGAGWLIWQFHLLFHVGSFIDIIGPALLVDLMIFVLATFVGGVISGLFPDRPSEIRKLAEDPERHSRMALCQFIGSIRKWLKSYNYAIECNELGLLPKHLEATLAEASEQLQNAIAYVDRGVRLWNLRQEGKELNAQNEPTVGLEFEKLREALDGLSSIAQSEEMEKVEAHIEAELALLDLQRSLGSLPLLQLQKSQTA